ncbi:MAG: ATP-binding protein [Holophagales bacterium]|nr:ATP-binding protein [Holophagales bacterium]
MDAAARAKTGGRGIAGPPANDPSERKPVHEDSTAPGGGAGARGDAEPLEADGQTSGIGAAQRRQSLAAQLLLLFLPSWILGAAAALAVAGLGLSALLAILAGTGVGLAVGVVIAWTAARRPAQLLQALGHGLAGLRSHDYSLRLASDRGDELGQMAELFNQLSAQLGRERSGLRRRELLLRSVIESSPSGVLLINAADRVILANRAARELFNHGRPLSGSSWGSVLEVCPEALRTAMDRGSNALVSLELDGGDEVFHVSRQLFELDSRRHLLVMVRRMSLELRRQEVAVWKKVIRVIAHELNNSLAPIRSMVHSARLIRASEGATDDERLDEILGHIDDSAAGIHRFIEGYGRFARLPEPRRQPVSLPTLLEPVAEAEPFHLECPVDPDSLELHVDAAQIRQVLLNLLENAREAGSPEHQRILEIEPRPGPFLLLRLLDRGSGMDAHTLTRALLPFYSAKKDGTGLGLALAREILEAHGGRITLANRPEGGLAVTCLLPLAGR